MGLERRIRRNNNIAGLRVQLEDKEKEIYMLSQQHDMQKTYFDEVTKISTALKNILQRELKLTDEDLMSMLETELNSDEAAEIDKIVAEKDDNVIEVDDTVVMPEIEFTKDDESQDIPEKYQKLAADGDKSDVEIRKDLKLDEEVKEKKAPKPRKPRKKKETKD